jgi:hypothetical protein
MGEISAASDEQSRGIDQVSGAVTQMDQVTQQNAALVEQAAAAAAALKDQTGRLRKLTSAWKVGQQAERVPAANDARQVVAARVGEPRSAVPAPKPALRRPAPAAVAVDAPAVARKATPAARVEAKQDAAARSDASADASWETF